MVVISRDDRQAACVSPNRLESIFLKYQDADPAVDCMQAPPALDSENRDSVEPQSIPEMQCGLFGGHRGGNFRHVIFAPRQLVRPRAVIARATC